MSIIKAIAGLGCLVAALYLGLFTMMGFRLAPLWLAGFYIVFTLGLLTVGLFLILKCRSVLPRKAKFLMALFLGMILSSTVILDLRIRHDRKVLQTRAREFLLRPIPKLLIPDSEGRVGDFYVDAAGGPQNGVFGYSRVLMARFAINARIRWSARIQGEFAITGEEVNGNFRTDAIDSDEEVRRYFEERKAILAEIWAMGYWQFIEDTIEFVGFPPEHREEDQDQRFVRRCEGSWTNEFSDRLGINHDNSFSLVLSSHEGTNSYRGDWIVGVGRPFFAFIFTSVTGAKPRWSAGDTAEFTIIRVDDHKLVYEVDHQTNLMGR